MKLVIAMMVASAVFAAIIGGLEVEARDLNPRNPEILVPPAGVNAFDISNADISKADRGADDDDDNDILFNYDPFPARSKNAVVITSARNANNNRIKSESYQQQSGVERSSSSSPPVIAREVMSAQPSEPKGSLNIDRVKDIASNSREVRLVGPDQKPVEMNDDLPTKFIVAMDNLKKEAGDVWGQVNEKLDKGWTELKRAEVWDQVNDKLDKGWTDLKRAEVWGQVNDKLDKGWTDFKSMVEGVVAPKKREN